MKRSRKKLLYPLITCAVCLADQGIKTIIRKLPLHECLYVIPGIVELTHYTNTGAAFSMLSGYTGFIALVSCALLGMLVFLLLRSMHLSSAAKAALAVLLGGGAGNLIDRLLFGGVTDYIRLLWIPFPVFNLADICITGSILFLSVYLMTGRLDTHPEETSHGTND